MAETNSAQALDPKGPVVEPEGVAKKKFDLDNPVVRALLPLLGLVILVLFFAVVTGGQFVTVRNLTLLLNQTYMLMIAAMGVFFVMTMGCLDFSVGSALGVASLVVCSLSQVNIVLAVVGGVCTGAVIGAVNGFFHAERQMPSFIVTICMMFLLRGVCAYFTTTAPIQAASDITNLTPLMLPLTVIVLAIGFFLFTFTKLGNNLKAIGAGEKAARFAGINVVKTKWLVYIAAGAITGFAAFVSAIKVGSTTSTTGSTYETYILIALVLGGMPISGGAKVRFENVITGVLMYRVLAAGLIMLGFPTETQQLIEGVVFMVFVYLFSDRKSIQVIK